MCRVSLLGPDSYLSSLLADIHYSFVFLFHCNRPNFMTVELYDQNYFFYRFSLGVFYLYQCSHLCLLLLLIYVCFCKCNCKSVAWLATFLSSYLLFCWWNCVEIGMSDIISCLVFIFSEICLSWGVGGLHCSTLWPNFQCMLYSLKI